MLQKSREGFSLIELMVALMILGLIMAIAVPGYLNYQARARRRTTIASLNVVGQGVDQFHMEFNKYPKALQELVKPPQGYPSFLAKGKVPKDGYGNDFNYKTPGKKHPYDLYSFGPNGPEADPEEYISVWDV